MKSKAPAKKLRSKQPKLRPSPTQPVALSELPRVLDASRSLLPDASEMRALDSAAISGGIPELTLMERAGQSVCSVVTPFLEGKGARACIVCGPGNNGGDGLVVARLLAKARISVSVVILSAPRVSASFLAQIEQIVSVRARLLTISLFKKQDDSSSDSACAESLSRLRIKEISEAQFLNTLESSDVVVDAIFGTGHVTSAQRVVRAIDLINQVRSSCPSQTVVAIDVPSGIDSSEGQVASSAVRADCTVAIELMKRGMLQHPAVDYLGKVCVAPIGISEASDPSLRSSSFTLITHAYATALRPKPRARNSHKGSVRQILVIGGCESFPGAPILTGHAALLAGGSRVTVTRRRGENGVPWPPELMHLPVDGNPGAPWLPVILSWLRQERAILALGPGLGSAKDARALVESFLTHLCSAAASGSAAQHTTRLVLDADGLRALAQLAADGQNFKLPFAILTPHPGEAARLLQVSVEEIESARYEACSKIAQKFGTTVILKGPSSVIASIANDCSAVNPQELPLRGAVNVAGTPWLATAGSGDVLTGIAAALLAQGLEVFDAACLSAYVHGTAGILAHERSGGPILASDIVQRLPQAISALNL